MSVFASFVPLLVGSIFFAMGANMILHFYKFRARSKRAPGRVTAIEKYISRTRTSQGHSSQAFFRPIVEFTYNGETHKAFGPSLSEVRHKLGQTVNVLINEDEHGNGIQTMLDDNIRVVFGAVFAVVGIGALGVHVFGVGGSPFVVVGVAGAFFAIGYALANVMLNFTFPGMGDDEATPKADSTLITTPQQFREEVSSHGFWGAVIAWGFMLISIGILAGGLLNLPLEASDMMANDFGAFWDEVTSGHMKSSWEGPVIMTGMGAFFFLASIRSVYYVHKKYGALLSR